MTNRLYVRGIPYSTTEADLRAHFGSVGPLRAVQVVYDRDTGRSKGFAFVEYGTEEEAKQAIQKFDGSELGGRRIMVSEARPRGERPPLSTGPSGSYAPRVPGAGPRFGTGPRPPGGPFRPGGPGAPPGAVPDRPRRTAGGGGPRPPRPAWKEAKDRREREARMNRLHKNLERDSKDFDPEQELEM